MTKEYFISLFLDTRRKKNNGKYPVKLRVFTPVPRMQKLYATKFEFTESEFKAVWETTKPQKVHKDDRLKLQALESEANRIADKLPYFDFNDFERLLLSKSKDVDVSFYYQQTIELYKKNKQIGTASNYELSLKSLLVFHNKEKLSFYDITPQWLKDYEHFMLSEENGRKAKSHSTIGIYLRPLRAIFNKAISDKIIDSAYYPFGKRKYNIPAPKGSKKALSREQLKLLFETEPNTPEQRKAKAFFFFSYGCNGMNLKDIANLKYKNITGDILKFSRAKTINTNKTQAPVIVYLNEYTKAIISEYGDPDKKPDNYIFDIIDHKDTPEEQHRELKNFVRYLNQHIKKLAVTLKLPENISTYTARHSFATSAIRNGASMEYVSEALSHSNLNTTKAYFAGFEDKEKKRISDKLMEF